MPTHEVTLSSKNQENKKEKLLEQGFCPKRIPVQAFEAKNHW
jgi:hypothetical protein